jgi:MFS family permease
MDIACRKCGYNLRGLSTDGRCPECGTPVGYSFHGDLLRFCDPNWVETLHKGAKSFIIGVVVIILGSIIVGMMGAATGSSAVVVLLSLVVIVGWGLTVLGWWRMTEPDPSGLGEDQYGTSRKIIRFALIVGIVQQVLNLLTRMLGPDSAAGIGLQVLAAVAGIIGVVGFFAQLTYLKKLALRLPDQPLSNRANFLLYALPISYGLVIVAGGLMALTVRNAQPGTGAGGALASFGCFMAIVGIAVIVFAIMYLFLVEKMGKRFKQEADAARATWAATAFAPPPPAQA